MYAKPTNLEATDSPQSLISTDISTAPSNMKSARSAELTSQCSKPLPLNWAAPRNMRENVLTLATFQSRLQSKETASRKAALISLTRPVDQPLMSALKLTAWSKIPCMDVADSVFHDDKPFPWKDVAPAKAPLKFLTLETSCTEKRQ